mmetsp:Transcript_13595/g.44308  ORF Transcript_13595/g.44308 Transcript_13595/m.44308 type:complete len:240 (-) Transcript_13595:411-1130(-)
MGHAVGQSRVVPFDEGPVPEEDDALHHPEDVQVATVAPGLGPGEVEEDSALREVVDGHELADCLRQGVLLGPPPRRRWSGLAVAGVGVDAEDAAAPEVVAVHGDAADVDEVRSLHRQAQRLEPGEVSPVVDALRLENHCPPPERGVVLWRPVGPGQGRDAPFEGAPRRQIARAKVGIGNEHAALVVAELLVDHQQWVALAVARRRPGKAVGDVRESLFLREQLGDDLRRRHCLVSGRKE